METLVINIPEKKSALVKQLLKELGVTIDKKAVVKTSKSRTPNALTMKTIDEARKGFGIAGPVKDIKDYVNSL